ncbi:MAG: hypothetical protein LH470_07740 [Lysobacter sp.]|nr:hypothetical protein [Lysobacter sp.]
MSRKRKLALIAGGIAILLLVLALSLRVALQPERVTRLILDQTGRALGLEITASGIGEYRLRGTPMLVVRGVVAREPGAAVPLLRAERIHLSLPWSTLRARGADLTVKRIELDAPILDLPALQHWLSTRTPGEDRIPTLTDGLRVTRGTLKNANWSIDGIDVGLPKLAPDQPVNAQVRGRYLDPPRRITFAVAVALSRPARNAGLAIVGPVTVHSDDWSLPARIKLSGHLRISGDNWQMIPARLAMNARYRSTSTEIPFALGLSGPLQFENAIWSWTPVGVALRGKERVPDLDAYGALALGLELVVELDGNIPAWPEAWPTLPPPLSASTSRLAFDLRYRGNADLSAVAALRLQRDATRFEGRLRFFDVSKWINTRQPASPLPPLDGVLTTPTMEIAGAQLEDVEIIFDDPAVPAIEPTP